MLARALATTRIPAACARHEQQAPLLLLHGLLGSSSNFRTPAKQLNAHREVVLTDLRNHGRSPWDDDCSIEAMAHDVIELLAQEDEPAVVCGHSLGGKVAMAAALLAPERVERLCVVDIAPVSYANDTPQWAATRELARAMAEMPLASLGSRAAADAALQAAVQPPPPDGVRQFLLQNLMPDQSAWRANVGALSRQIDEISTFPCDLPPAAALPTLFISGGKSDYIRAEHHAPATALFPAARFESVPGAGHWVHAEAPSRFVELLRGFMGEGVE